jgi:hypothetical protein
MRALALALLLLISAAPAFARPQGESRQQAVDYVEVGPVALPIVVEGRLRNYVFATLRLHLRPGAEADYWSDREPYLRDALVRAAHRTPFVIPNEWMRVDEPALKRTMLSEANRIAGSAVFVSVEVVKTSPQRRVVATKP